MRPFTLVHAPGPPNPSSLSAAIGLEHQDCKGGGGRRTKKNNDPGSYAIRIPRGCTRPKDPGKNRIWTGEGNVRTILTGLRRDQTWGHETGECVRSCVNTSVERHVLPRFGP